MRLSGSVGDRQCEEKDAVGFTIMTMPNALTPSKVLFLATGLAGSLFISLSAQFPSTNIADVQGGLFSTPDEASWILTVYTMASFAGIVTSGPLIKFLGIGRYLVVSATTFAVTALACTAAPDLQVMIALRTIQGLRPAVSVLRRSSPSSWSRAGRAFRSA